MINWTENAFVDSFYSNKAKGIFYLPIHVYLKFPNIIEFHATKCSIKKVSAQNFKNLKYVSSLILNDNQIESIEEKSFDDLQSLEVLFMQQNKIASLPPNLFSKVRFLREINFNHNQIKNLAENTFLSLKRLEIIDFDYNQIKRLLCVVSNNAQLKSVSFARNSIEFIDKSIAYLPFWTKYVTFRQNKCINACFGESPFISQTCLSNGTEMKVLLERCIPNSFNDYLDEF